MAIFNGALTRPLQFATFCQDTKAQAESVDAEAAASDDANAAHPSEAQTDQSEETAAQSQQDENGTSEASKDHQQQPDPSQSESNSESKPESTANASDQGANVTAATDKDKEKEVEEQSVETNPNANTNADADANANASTKANANTNANTNANASEAEPKVGAETAASGGEPFPVDLVPGARVGAFEDPYDENSEFWTGTMKSIATTNTNANANANGQEDGPSVVVEFDNGVTKVVPVGGVVLLDSVGGEDESEGEATNTNNGDGDGDNDGAFGDSADFFPGDEVGVFSSAEPGDDDVYVVAVVVQVLGDGATVEVQYKNGTTDVVDEGRLALVSDIEAPSDEEEESYTDTDDESV